MATREQVLKVVSQTIRVRNFSLRTEECYCHWIGRFFATHSPDDPRTIQAVMGHKQLETTMGYIHREALSAGNPLDIMEAVPC